MGFRKDKAEPAPAAAEPAHGVSSPGYGIQQATELMRSLPADLQTTDIVVQVIKRTLESAHIDVGSIIADATRKEEQIAIRLRSLQEEISTHQREIEARISEIRRLQVDLDDILRVKDRLAPG